MYKLCSEILTELEKDGVKINHDFEFPEKQELKIRLKDILDEQVDENYYLSEERIEKIREWEKRQRENGRGFRFEVKDRNSIGRAVTTNGDRPCSTNYVFDGGRVRRLTPKESWRLMGFDDADFERAAKVNSNTQLFKQAGNSIVVKVLEEILGNLFQ